MSLLSSTITTYKWFFIFSFLAGTTVGAIGFKLNHEKSMEEQAREYCTCHGGLRGAVYLEEFSSLRMTCKDGEAKMFYYGQKLEACKPDKKEEK